MALVCSMALIVGALSGCGNSGSKAESTPAETKAGSTEAVTPSTSGPVNITICSAAFRWCVVYNRRGNCRFVSE